MSTEDDPLIQFEGDEIPPFANEANKKLDRDVRLKKQKVEDVDTKTHEVSERLVVLTNHLKNVKHEVENTQALIAAKKKEIESEEHMCALTERQSGRLEAEHKKLDRIIQEYLDRANALQTEIFKGNEKLDQLKLEMNWNQEELEQWALAARQKEEDQLTLEKYSRADEIKVRDLTLAAEKLTVELAKKKKALDREVTETQAAQLELDRTAAHFKFLHNERHKLLQQWQDTHKLFSAKEMSISATKDRFTDQQRDIVRKGQVLKQEQEILKQAQEDCRRLNGQIQTTDRSLAELRLEALNAEKATKEFNDEVTLMRSELGAISSQLAFRKDQLSNYAMDVEKKKAQLVKLQKSEKSTSIKLEQHKNISMSKEKLAQEADSLLHQMQTRLEECQRELKQTKDLLFSHNQNLYKLKNQEATIMGEISGAEASKKTLDFQLHRLDQERQRQQELMYRVEYECQIMLREVARVSGERTVDEQRDLKRRINEAKELVESNQKFAKSISAQIKKLDSDIRHAQRSCTEAEKRESVCMESLEKLNLECSSLNRAANIATKTRDGELVQLDKLQLEAKRLRELVNQKGNEVCKLKNKLDQIKLALRDRTMEVKVQTETCKASVRTAEEERHQLVLELAERRQKVAQLSAKHASLAARNQGPTVEGEEGGERKSQAYHLIKAAQEKEALQRKGDLLEARNLEGERVLKSLQNMLAHLIARNQAYKENFQKGSSANVDLQLKEEKESLLRASNEALFLKQKELNQTIREVEVEMARIRELQRRKEEAQNKIVSISAEKIQLERVLIEQDQEVDDAHREMIEKRQAAVDAQALEGDRAAIVETHVQSAIVEEQNKVLLKALVDTFADNPMVSSTIRRVFDEIGLKVPVA
eukprot:GDKK01058582.1.p1 GENE.GDKK01058582.1~~GDKK01058582.1.p1  ORF type:complete len:878 (+),score=234.75 GDKK01058582.1:74-2707(+)